MDWPTYQRLSDQSNYWSRWMLEQCIELFVRSGEFELGNALQQALQQPPLERPADHKGSPQTYMFRLQLSQAQRLLGLAAVRKAVSLGETTAATQKRGLGGFVEAWQEYAHSTGC